MSSQGAKGNSQRNRCQLNLTFQGKTTTEATNVFRGRSNQLETTLKATSSNVLTTLLTLGLKNANHFFVIVDHLCYLLLTNKTMETKTSKTKMVARDFAN